MQLNPFQILARNLNMSPFSAQLSRYTSLLRLPMVVMWAIILVVQGIGLFQLNLSSLAHQHRDHEQASQAASAAHIYDLAGRSYMFGQPKARLANAAHSHAGLSFHSHNFDLAKLTAKWFSPDAQNYSTASDTDNSPSLLLTLAPLHRSLPQVTSQGTHCSPSTERCSVVSVSPKRRERPPMLG